MTVATAISTLLAADVSLTATLTGGVWTRDLKRDGPGATTTAFAATGQVKPSAVVKDRGENADPAGPDDPGLALAAYGGFPQVWLYAPATTSGRTALEAAFTDIRALLHGAKVAGENGTGAGIRVVGRQGIDDDPVLTGAIVDVIRLQVDGLWA